ncbi:MAG: T9SS type A sorting domain-containing protein, partial [Saprospiraceae bacterium]
AKQDVTAEKVKITCNFSGNASEYFTINANETLLGKGKLVIEDSLQDPGIAFNYNEILSLNQYWDGNAALNFDTVIVDGEWKPFEQLAVTIDSIRPLSLRAGTDDLLTIYGSGFGTTQGNSYVEFTNAFEGTVNGVDWIQPLLTDYNFWSETKIEVFVPSVAKDGVYTEYAGSGKIRVKIVNNSVKTSSESLNVRFAVDNRARADIGQSELKRKKVRLIGDFSEDNSGYVLYYSENFKNLSGAVPAFERALCTWIQTDNINFKIKDYPDIAPFYQQYACQIILSDLLPDGNPSSTKAVTTKEYFSACLDGNGSILKFALKKFDIYFRQFEDWYVNQEYDPTLPFSFWENNHDLESFALHELGHAQLLLHVNQNDDIMYFEVLTPNRTPHTNDIEGGDYIKQISNIAEPNCTINPMIQLDDCTSSYLEALNIKKQIEYWPNPSFNNLFIESSKIIENIKIFDLLGRVQLETFPNSKSISINVSMLNQGIYFGVLKEGNNFHQIKFEKL